MKHMTDASAPQKTGAEDVIWDLSVLYSGMDDPMIDSDINKINQMADEFVAAYRGRVAEMDAEDFVDAFKKREAIYDLGAKVSSFASLNYTVYSTDENWGAFMQKIQETFATFQQKMVFFGVEWNAVEDAQAEQILADPTLGEYQYHLETMRLSKPYSLSEAEERVIIMKDVTGNSAWTRFFDQLMAAQSFEWDGETINQPQLLVKLYDKDRDVRQRAAGKMTEALREKSMELTYIYNTLAADKAQEDKLRGYESWITSRNIANRATSDVVDALVDSVTSRYDIVARHYHIKRALLGVDELYDYDRYAPLDLKESEAFYTWEQARDIVLNAYEAFSPSVADVARKFFDENWIHAPAMKGKRGGAYASYGSHSTHPFVFVNFNGTANDVMTLAHELGHGVHMYLAARNQNIFGMYTPLTTAEMASTFGEMLVFRDLLSKESDDEVRLSMIASKIEDTFATVFRQTAMNRFEDGMHTARRTEGELRTERLNEIWMETQQAMFQDSVTMRPEYAQWWSYIPHFLHTPGYVYAYSFGELLVLALYNVYLSEGESFVPKYEQLLKDGDSDYPHKLLAKVGIDLNDTSFWHQGLDALSALVDEEEKLAKALYPDKF
jgi:oligoendopeptidase F